MNEISPALLEATAASYEERLVPAVFQIWTEDMLDAAGIAPGDRVLDVACGTGVLARAAAKRVGPDGMVAGLDLNPAMLSVARSILPEIDWRQGDVLALPFEDGLFNAVTCQFGFMFFPDTVAALEEMGRVAKSGGAIAIAVFDGLAGNEGYDRLSRVFEDKAGEAVGDALRMPFALGDATALAADFARAGLGQAKVVTKTKTESFADARSLVLSDVEGWFPLAGFHLDEATVDAVVVAVEQAMAPYTTGDGRIEFPVQAHILSTAKD